MLISSVGLEYIGFYEQFREFFKDNFDCQIFVKKSLVSHTLTSKLIPI